MVIVHSYLLGVPYSEVGTETERWNETLPLNSISGQSFLSNMLGARACDTLPDGNDGTSDIDCWD